MILARFPPEVVEVIVPELVNSPEFLLFISPPVVKVIPPLFVITPSFRISRFVVMIISPLFVRPPTILMSRFAVFANVTPFGIIRVSVAAIVI